MIASNPINYDNSAVSIKEKQDAATVLYHPVSQPFSYLIL